MKKLMKSAALLASIGAMLYFAGCGKDNTDKSAVPNAKATTSHGTTQEVTTPQVQLSSADEMASLARKINAELTKHGAEPLTSMEDIIHMRKKMSPEEAKEQLARMRSTLPLLVSYSSMIKDINNLCKEMGGNPYLDEKDISRNIERFLSKSTHAQQEAISEAREVLRCLKEAKK